MGKKDLSPEMQECLKVLEKFVANPESEPFRLPVEWKAWGLLDYPQIVKEPMDLGSIRTNLMANKYDDLTTFVRDMKLVWHNCMTYNADNSSYYKVALKLDKLLDKEVTKLAKKFGASAKGLLKDSSSTLLASMKLMKPVSADEKARFCRNVYEIRAVSLGKVVQMIDDNCPSALNKSNPEEVEIIVDLVDTTTFRALDTFVKECVAKEKLRKKNKKKDKAAAATAAAAAADANKNNADATNGSATKKEKPAVVVQPHTAKTPAEKKKEEEAKKEAAEKKTNSLKRPRPEDEVPPAPPAPAAASSSTEPAAAPTPAAAVGAPADAAAAPVVVAAVAKEEATAMETDTTVVAVAPADATIEGGDKTADTKMDETMDAAAAAVVTPAVVADIVPVVSVPAESAEPPASKRAKVDPATEVAPAVTPAVTATPAAEAAPAVAAVVVNEPAAAAAPVIESAAAPTEPAVGVAVAAAPAAAAPASSS